MDMSEHTKTGLHGLRGELRMAEPMASHTSWRAGGCADRAYIPADLDDLRAFLASLPQHEPVYLVGLGSNLLVRDGGVRGTVIFTQRVLNRIRVENHLTPHVSRLTIFAEAGVPCPKLARFAAMHELGGAEFMAGIPGTVGGALAMNAGCYGGETWNIVASVTTVNRKGELCERQRSDYEIGYRTVVLKAEGGRTKDQENPNGRIHPSSLIPRKSGSSPRASSCRAATARRRARRSSCCSSGASRRSRSISPTPDPYFATRRAITQRA